jgi:hypothetical protein
MFAFSEDGEMLEELCRQAESGESLVAEIDGHDVEEHTRVGADEVDTVSRFQRRESRPSAAARALG